MADEFDIKFDDEEIYDRDETNEPNRGMVAGTGRKFLEAFTGEPPVEDVKKLVNSGMPEVIGAAADDNVKDAVGDFAEELDKSFTSMKKSARPIVRKLKKKLDKESFLGKAAHTVLNAFDDEDHSDSGPTKEELLTEQINRDISNALGTRDADREMTLLLEETKHNMALSSDAKLASLVAVSKASLKFKNDVTRSYYGKSLELQYRLLNVNKDILGSTNLGFDSLTKLSEVIVKNTGLPDFIKLRSMEAVKHKIREGFAEDIREKLTGSGSSFERAMINAKKVVSNMTSNVTSMLNGVGEGMEASEDMDAEMRQAMLAGGLADSVKAKIGKFIGREIRSTEIGRNIDDSVNDFLSDPSAYMADKANGTDNKFLAKLFKGASRVLRGNEDLSYKKLMDKESPDAAATLDNRMYDTITKSIPGYLSRILAAIEMSNGKNDGALKYDYKTDSFVRSKDIESLLKTDLTSIVRTGDVSTKVLRIVKSMQNNSDVKFSKKETQEIAKRLYDFSRLGKSMSIRSLEDYGFFESFSTPELGIKVKMLMKESIKREDGSIDGSKSFSLNKELQGIQSLAKYDDSLAISKMVDSGYTEELEKMGIVTYDPLTGKKVVSVDKLHELRSETLQKSVVEQMYKLESISGIDSTDDRSFEDGFIKGAINKLRKMTINELNGITVESVESFRVRISVAFDKSPLSNKFARAEKKFRQGLGRYLRIDYRPNKIGGKGAFYARLAAMAKNDKRLKKKIQSYIDRAPEDVKVHGKLFKTLIFKTYTGILKSDKAGEVKLAFISGGNKLKKWLEANGDRAFEDLAKDGASNVKGAYDKVLDILKKKSKELDTKEKRDHKREELFNKTKAVKDRVKEETVDPFLKKHDDEITAAKKEVEDRLDDVKASKAYTWLEKKYDEIKSTVLDKSSDAKDAINRKREDLKSKSEKLTKDAENNLESNVTSGIDKPKEAATDVLKDIKETLEETFAFEKKNKQEEDERVAEQEKSEAKRKKREEIERRKAEIKRKRQRARDRDGDGYRDGGFYDKDETVTSGSKSKSNDKKSLYKRFKEGGLLGILGTIIATPFKLIEGLSDGIKSIIGFGSGGKGGSGWALGAAMGAGGYVLSKTWEVTKGVITGLPKVLEKLGKVSDGLYTAGKWLTKSLAKMGIFAISGKKGLDAVKSAKTKTGKLSSKVLGRVKGVKGLILKAAVALGLIGAADAAIDSISDTDTNDIPETPKKDKVRKIHGRRGGHNVHPHTDNVHSVKSHGGHGYRIIRTLKRVWPNSIETKHKRKVIDKWKKKGGIVVDDATEVRKVVDKTGKVSYIAGKLHRGVFKSIKVFPKLPVVGILIAGGLAATRVTEGDYIGAAMEVISGIVSIIPFIGLPLSLAIDGAILYRDMHNGTNIAMEGDSAADKMDVTTDEKITAIRKASKDVKTVTKALVSKESPKKSDTDAHANGRGHKKSFEHNNTKKSNDDIGASNISPDTSYGVSELKGEVGFVAKVIRIVETNDKYGVVGNIGDSGGISFGAYQFTETSGSLKQFLKNYIALKPLTISRAKAYYRKMSKTKFNGNRRRFTNWLKMISTTKDGVKAQDQTFVEMYYNPAIRAMPKNVKSLIVRVNVIDAFHNGGGRQIAKALKNDSLEEIERLRIQYWKSTPGWSRWGKGWLNRLEKIRRLVGDKSSQTSHVIEDVREEEKLANGDIEPSTEPSGNVLVDTVLNSLKSIVSMFGSKPGSVSKTDHVPGTPRSGGVNAIRKGQTKQITAKNTIDPSEKRDLPKGKFSSLGQVVGNIGEIKPSTMNGGEIVNITVHCSATPIGKSFTAIDIDKMHKDRGWSGCGYHFIILLDGTIQYGRNYNYTGAHVKGHNAGNIGVCYIGGVKADGKTDAVDQLTDAQQNAIINLTHYLAKIHNLSVNKIVGHNEFPNVAKSCPNLTMANIRGAKVVDVPESTKKEANNDVPETKTVAERHKDALKKGIVNGNLANSPLGKSVKTGMLTAAAATAMAANGNVVTESPMDPTVQTHAVDISKSAQKVSTSTKTPSLHMTTKVTKAAPRNIPAPVRTESDERAITTNIERKLDHQIALQTQMVKLLTEIADNKLSVGLDESQLGNKPQSETPTKVRETVRRKVPVKTEPVIKVNEQERQNETDSSIHMRHGHGR